MHTSVRAAQVTYTKCLYVPKKLMGSQSFSQVAVPFSISSITLKPDNHVNDSDRDDGDCHVMTYGNNFNAFTYLA